MRSWRARGSPTERRRSREELSGGERQRFALCAALAHKPAILLADEPTGELDEASAGAVRSLIAELARSDGTSVIVVSHDEAIASIADRTVRIRDGRVVEDRRDGHDALIVNRGGWLRLPSEMLGDAGIRRRANVRRGADGLIVTPALGTDEPPPAPPPPISAPRKVTSAKVALRSISKAYGARQSRQSVIERLTYDFAPGRLTTVTGPSGSGKTSLLRLIAGLDLPESGQLLIDERPLGDRDAEGLAALRRERIGFLAQEPSLVDFLSATENVALALRLRGWDAHAARKRAETTLTGVGLARRASQRVHRLSAGEQQRVALARALASANGLLVVDEPTSRLDEANAAIIARLLAAGAADERQTVICATHDPQVIRRADRILTLAGEGPDLPGLRGDRTGARHQYLR